MGVAPVKTALTVCSVLLLAGCSKWGDPVSGAKMSGDLTQFLVSCATTRGGHPITNGLSVIEAQWTVQSNLTQHTIYVHGDHFDQIESLLIQAFGVADTARGSSPAARVGKYSTRSGWYDPRQSGSAISFSGDAVQTIVCLNGPFSPRP